MKSLQRWNPLPQVFKTRKPTVSNIQIAIDTLRDRFQHLPEEETPTEARQHQRDAISTTNTASIFSLPTDEESTRHTHCNMAKLKEHWNGPFVVVNVDKFNTYRLQELDGTLLKPRVAGKRVRIFYQRVDDGDRVIPFVDGELDGDDGVEDDDGTDDLNLGEGREF